MADNRCTIIVSNERFDFTRDQLESDPGNYFAMYFFGEFAEASRGVRELVVDKDVRLFRIIQAHLRGYEIFPLPDSAIPHYMTKEVAIKNLRTDAQYYCLGRLEEKIKEFELISSKMAIDEGRKSSLVKRYKFGMAMDETWSGLEWMFQDLNNDGYQLMLGKLKNLDMAIPSEQPLIPGFSLTFCWAKEHRYYVLLASDD